MCAVNGSWCGCEPYGCSDGAVTLNPRWLCRSCHMTLFDRYVLLKDPTKPVMRLYSRPEDEDEDGEEEERRPDGRGEITEGVRNDED